MMRKDWRKNKKGQLECQYTGKNDSAAIERMPNLLVRTCVLLMDISLLFVVNRALQQVVEAYICVNFRHSLMISAVNFFIFRQRSESQGFPIRNY